MTAVVSGSSQMMCASSTFASRTRWSAQTDALNKISSMRAGDRIRYANA